LKEEVFDNFSFVPMMVGKKWITNLESIVDSNQFEVNTKGN
jgi:hypothetical protein